MDTSNISSRQQHNSGCDAGLTEQRKRQRLISNRESARRSRLRKQSHLDGLTARVAELRTENRQIVAGLRVTSENFVSVESENAVLRAQMVELNHRLRALDEIAAFVGGGYGYGTAELEHGFWNGFGTAEFGNGYWNCSNEPIVMPPASTDFGFLY